MEQSIRLRLLKSEERTPDSREANLYLFRFEQ